MVIGDVDMEAISNILAALSSGPRKAETETGDGRKVVGYYVTDKQIRVDILEVKNKNS